MTSMSTPTLTSPHIAICGVCGKNRADPHRRVTMGFANYIFTFCYVTSFYLFSSVIHKLQKLTYAYFDSVILITAFDEPRYAVKFRCESTPKFTACASRATHASIAGSPCPTCCLPSLISEGSFIEPTIVYRAHASDFSTGLCNKNNDTAHTYVLC